MSIQVQIGLNRYKYVQIGPNESNWVQMGPNRYKQVQQRQRKSTKIKIKTNQAIGRYWKKQVQMGSNGSIGVQNYHELNRMAFKPRSPGSCIYNVVIKNQIISMFHFPSSNCQTSQGQLSLQNSLATQVLINICLKQNRLTRKFEIMVSQTQSS